MVKCWFATLVLATSVNLYNTEYTFDVKKNIARAGNLAKIGMPIHPPMLRHSTGFKWLTMGGILEVFNIIWDIKIFNILCYILT